MNLDKLINDTINNNSLVKINNNIFLTQYQIAVLERFHIEYATCNSIQEILFLIDDYLDTDYEEELDEISRSLQEFNYYNYTNK